MSIHLVFVNIRSALNVGSILRTADAFGVEKVWVTGYTPAPDLPVVKKTSLGAEKSVAWERIVDPIACLDQLKADGVAIYAIECGADGSTSLQDAEIPNPCAFVFGNEVEGLSRMQLERCDGILEIPMGGTKESLNVAVAAGIVLWAVSHNNQNNQTT